MEIRVDCYAGYRSEETPRRLIMGARHINVVTIQDRWLAPDHRYFKIIGDDGGLYIIRHHPFQDTWQLTYFTENPLNLSVSPHLKGSFPHPSRQYPSSRQSWTTD